METMTIEDALKITVKTLENIKIPAAMSIEVGIPIAKSITNINSCISVIENAKEKAKEEKDNSTKEIKDGEKNAEV